MNGEIARSPRTVAIVLGTRPEGIKLAPVYRALAARPKSFRPLLWVTGQHRQMLDPVLGTFGLKADRDFNLMQPGQTLSHLTAAILQALEKAFEQERPDCILVQGDTTTVLAGSLSAFYFKIPVGHVEAGLRTPTKYVPFPEEMNRRLATRLADFHFAPTEQAQGNLLAEGVPADRIWVTGNTVIDALDLALEKVRRTPPEFPDGFPLEAIDSGRKMVLITGHRRENFGARLESICRAIEELARRYPETDFVYPVHLNPQVHEPVYRLLGGWANIHLTDPLHYEPFVWAMDRCYFLLSDSGGIQEEALHLGKPILVMRERTERPEVLEGGTARLVGFDYDVIVREGSALLDNPEKRQAMSRVRNPFGDGRAAQRIAEILAGLEF